MSLDIKKYNTIFLNISEDTAILTLNRPDKLNALNREMLYELDDLIKGIDKSNVKALIITGSGEKAFAAGADISELNKCDEISGKTFSEYGSYVFKRIEQLRIPVIAAINGFALGGGCELAMACHIRYASDKAKFGQPEINLGIVPGYGGTQRLPRIVGKSKALELILTGKIIDASEADRIGLVDNVFTQEDLMPKAMETAKLIASKSSVIVSASIDCINASSVTGLLEGLHFESIVFGKMCGTDDFKEGTLAYLEKRKPDFTDK